MKVKSALMAAGLLLAAVPAHADRPEMPKFLAGQWCMTSGTDDDGEYVRAKNFCRPDRRRVFIVHPLGFWIRFAGTKTSIMCVQVAVEPWAHGWNVTAHCGADDNSTAVRQMEFTFESWNRKDQLMISRRMP